jgi:hypothetical protein
MDAFAPSGRPPLGTANANYLQLWFPRRIGTTRSPGWVYGTAKDAEKKTHPCMVPYDKLPLAQRRKDALFQAAVRARADRHTWRRPPSPWVAHLSGFVAGLLLFDLAARRTTPGRP